MILSELFWFFCLLIEPVLCCAHEHLIVALSICCIVIASQDSGTPESPFSVLFKGGNISDCLLMLESNLSGSWRLTDLQSSAHLSETPL